MTERQDLSIEMNVLREREAPTPSEKRDAKWGCGCIKKRWWIAWTAHVDFAESGAWAIRIDTPLRKRSVLEDGRTRRMWVSSSKLGRNSTEEQVRCVAGLNELVLDDVNSPHLKNPAHASLMAAPNVALRVERGSWGASASFWSMLRVIGSSGLCVLLP